MILFGGHNPLPEYPRPGMRRGSYMNLNGTWEYTIRVGDRQGGVPAEGYAAPAWYEGEILVPFSPESRLSGVGRTLLPEDVLWYRRCFRFDEPGDGERILLNFEAVDWECACWVNNVLVGTHRGGYGPFSFDITEALCRNDADDEILVCVLDPTDAGAQPRGKQRLNAKGIWYPSQSGIWQTVWAEIVPARRVVSMEAVGDIRASSVMLRVATSCVGGSLSAEVWDGDGLVVRHACYVVGSGATVRIPVESPHLWSPESPSLYRVCVRFERDVVEGYCAFRTISLGNDGAGTGGLLLNGEPVTLRGVLVQGYWPDGLMTAPSDEALIADIKAAKAHGFNAIRMHAKVERRRFYYHCDALGMLVIQDLVPGGRHIRMRLAGWLPLRYPSTRYLVGDGNPVVWYLLGAGSRAEREEWLREAMEQMETLRSHPCVVAWTVFNEGWGQHSARRITRLIKEIDPSRPVDSTSGWFDRCAGDFLSVHDYDERLRVLDAALGSRLLGLLRHGRLVLLSEFGGLSYAVPGHRSQEATWGYVQYDGGDQYREAFRVLMDAVERRLGQGLAGYVYTQLYDVEQECNGLLTYDREVDKFRES